MSDWYVIGAGFYAVDPVGTLFAQAVVDFGVGKQLIAEASENDATTVYQVRERTYLRSKDS